MTDEPSGGSGGASGAVPSDMTEEPGDVSEAPTALSVEGFPNVQLLRAASGDPIGLFSDHGSWLGVTWGERAGLDVWDLTDGTIHHVDLGSASTHRVAWADRLECRLDDGSALRVGFAPDGLLVLERAEVDSAGASGAPIDITSDLPTRAHARRGARRLVIGRGAEGAPPPAADLFESNRARWNEVFARAAAVCRPALRHADAELLARALTTLLWNRRAATARIPAAGVIPSPFAYRGYWAWDSWKHAHALAPVDPSLAADCLRTQLSRQRDDGMVSDTVFSDPADDNWSNTKPPSAARALLRIVEAGGGDELAAELFGPCARQMAWFAAARRLPGEALFRAGGVDHTTATWDTGWDDCARFEGVPLVPHGDWLLFDLWQPDYNAYCLEELRALAALAPRVGADAEPWRARAEELAGAIADVLWDRERSCFCDVRPSTGQSTGIRSAAAWLPLRAGAASASQADAVRALLASPEHFDTPFPFPTLAASEAAFAPDGYWNGSVWIDHSAAAIDVLGSRGETQRRRLLDGIARHRAFYECYSPLTDEPAGGSRPAVPQFSWTAASVLELLFHEAR